MTDKQKITEILKAYTKKHNISASSVILEEYAEELLANGAIVPPCKVGDIVYYISFGKVYKGKCHTITIHENSVQIHLYDYDGDNASISTNRVFLTKEEAEEKLKELKNNA